MGTVDYDGRFHFRLYPNLLIYSHRTETWWETGEQRLSTALQEPLVLKPPKFSPWTSSTSQSDFVAMVSKAQEWIASGDIYQVNLAHRFSTQLLAGDFRALYEQLRTQSPAPMAGYVHQGAREVLSSSPELFLRFSGNAVQTKPIKGTRPRYTDPARDIRASHELKTSPKEMSELVMITDLLRNDLGKVSDYGTVQVDLLAQLESLAQVHHLVSTVSGTLKDEVSHLDALRSCWPGGSITGAPKKRACEIIEDLEPVDRGLYTGSIGYFGLNGESQFNIAIRTLVREGAEVHYHVGAGIVADSQPLLEYEETLHKGKGIRLALGLE